MRHLYRRAIAYMDDWLAGVLEALDRAGSSSETLVIVTSDHGENFGEEGLIAHGFSLDERLIHVPFVMRRPRRAGADRGVHARRAASDSSRALPRSPITRGPSRPPGIAVAQYDSMGPATDPRVQKFVERWGVDEAGVSRLTASTSRPRPTGGGRWSCATERNCSTTWTPIHSRSVRSPRRHPGSRRCAPRRRRPLAEPAVAPVPADEVAAPSGEELAALEQQMKLLGYM